MDALVLAAGRGSRLGSATDDRPKTLVDLGGITPLEVQIEALIGSGIRRVVIVTGYRRRQIEAVASERAAGRLRIEFVWNPFWSLTNVIGSAWIAWPHMSDSFVYLHADTVFEPGILDDLLASSGSAVAVDFRACEPEQMKVALSDGRVRHLSKEMPPAEAVGEFIGLAVVRPPAIDALKLGIAAVLERNDFAAYFEEGVNAAIAAAQLEIVPVATEGRRWTEIDFPEDLELARQILPSLFREAS